MILKALQPVVVLLLIAVEVEIIKFSLIYKICKYPMFILM